MSAASADGDVSKNRSVRKLIGTLPVSYWQIAGLVWFVAVLPHPILQGANGMSGSTKNENAEVLSIDGREVRISHPEKLYFTKQIQLSKLDIIKYYLAVAPGALQGIENRPIVLKRFVNGAESDAFYQKRAP